MESSAQTEDQKLDLLARILHCWLKTPHLHLVELLGEATTTTFPFIDDSTFVQAVEQYVQEQEK